MGELFIFGAAGHAKVVADLALRAGWQIAAFVETNPHQSEFWQRPVVAEAELTAEGPRGRAAFVAIGQNAVRAKIQQRLLAAGWQVPTLIHPSSVLAPDVTVGPGTAIMAGVVVNPAATIGQGVILNTSCSVDHDCRVADFVHISPGARLAGTVVVESGSWIGVGAAVIQGITIGARTMIGAGSVVVRDIPQGVVAFGVPAQVHRVAE